MQRQRLLLFLVSAFAVLLIFLWIISAFFQIIYQLEYLIGRILPFLPYQLIPLVIIISIVFLVFGVVQFAWPWWKSFYRPGLINKKNITNSVNIPKSRRQAAKQTLEGLELLIERLQDNVAKEALRFERERVAKELARRDLTVVIFGTGSSGKTSLIRALLNQMIGEVSAAMGATKKSKIYRLRLKGFDRCIQIIDTPGIFESGEDGFAREKEARVKASQADLLIVVLDSDLRAGELQTIKTLERLGKRIILVLNKCDLRGEEEEKRLIALLKGTCKDLINPEDVIACSASPQSIPRIGKKPLKPESEVGNLLERLAKILYEEGEELLADNILLQCKNLGDSGRELLDNQRKTSARKCVDKFSWISSGLVAANPLPGIDLLGTAAVNAQMVIEIAKIYGVELTKSRAQELALSVGKTLAGLGVVKGSVSIIGTSLSLHLPTLILGRAVQGVAAAWLTRVAGATFITFFQQDQEWGDGGIQEVVQNHYNLNKRENTLNKFMNIAYRKVVEPLKKNKLRELPPRRRPLEEEASSDPEHPRW